MMDREGRGGKGGALPNRLVKLLLALTGHTTRTTHTCKLAANEALRCLAGWGRRPVVLVPFSPISGNHISMYHRRMHIWPSSPCHLLSCPVPPDDEPFPFLSLSLRLLCHDFHEMARPSFVLVGCFALPLPAASPSSTVMELARCSGIYRW
jgi:hypothetical protein